MKRLAMMAAFATAVGAQAQMRITEYEVGGSIGQGEFVEFTNIGNSAIDMTGWSFDDSSAAAGAYLLTFGVVAPGESVIMTDVFAADFRTAWGLAGNVQVSELNDQNLSSSNADGMNLFDNNGVLVDTLNYPDNQNPTPTISRNGPLSQLGLNNDAAWEQSFVGDSFGSWISSAGDTGNPGLYTPVPEPATLLVLGLGAAATLRRRRRA
ncbi:MAG: lamin tail domain-containing protein [Fimbriimonadaceae bacterium]|nr:lamin tail domain-containing protein [Chthonomonadaceae bacterium]MCO5296930.1 lamin tail domain-containing protein [Fimbriimonadaceae bacterium]